MSLTISAKRQEESIHDIVDLVGRRLPKAYNIKPGEIQVLTPMQRGVVGAANLNQVLQERINPGQNGLRRGGVELRNKDKVMPVLMTHYVMLQRNLVYTGVTRAKKLHVIVGTTKALGVAVRTVTVSRRNTMLVERIKEWKPTIEP